MSKRKTDGDYWKAIDVLYPTHRMGGQWHKLYKEEGYCTDEAPSGWGSFGCKRCDAIVMIEKRGKKIWPRTPVCDIKQYEECKYVNKI